MVLLLAAALVSSAPSHGASAGVQATATIRILSAVQLKFDSPVNDGAPPARDSRIKAADGTVKQAKLIEFQ